MIQSDPTPTVKELSDDFNDLLGKLLEKEPMCRPSWEELASHPFWKNDPFTSLPLPPQPQFDKYLKSKDVDPEHFYAQRSNPLAKKLIRESAKVDKDKQVDIIRLSHQVKKNMTQPDNYGQPEENHTSDIKLKNKDVELNFGKREDTPNKEHMIEASPHKNELEEELAEEEKIDYANEEFSDNKQTIGELPSIINFL